MSDAILGSIIVSIATGTLFLAVQSAEKAFRNAGKYPPTKYEVELLRKSGYSDEKSKALLKSDLESFPIKFND